MPDCDALQMRCCIFAKPNRLVRFDQINQEMENGTFLEIRPMQSGTAHFQSTPQNAGSRAEQTPRLLPHGALIIADQGGKYTSVRRAVHQRPYDGGFSRTGGATDEDAVLAHKHGTAMDQFTFVVPHQISAGRIAVKRAPR